jgi:hypothetical protein
MRCECGAFQPAKKVYLSELFAGAESVTSNAGGIDQAAE